MCLISVIVPVYNVSVYLRKCIDSIINNSYRKLEIILVDDGSTDDSGKICDLYAQKDGRIKVIHKKNGGLSSARNAGLDIATGDYISFIDSDDYISNNMYQLMISAAEHENADIVQCGAVRVDEKGNQSAAFHVENWKMEYDEIVDKYYTSTMIPVMLCNKIFKRDLIASRRMVEGRNNEDTMFMADILPYIKKFLSIENICYFYLKRSSSIMESNFSEKKFDSIYAYEYVLNKTEKLNSKYVPYVYYWRAVNAFYLYHSIWKSKLANKEEYYKRVCDEFYNSIAKIPENFKLNKTDQLRLNLFRFNKKLAVFIYDIYLRRKR